MLRRTSTVALGLLFGALLACKKGPQACPDKYANLSNEQRAGAFECSCEGGGTGPVWGAGVYTADSSICAAATHAGAKGPKGTVRVVPAAGCAAYQGTTANGVTSQSWPAYPASFYFEGHGTGACAEAGCPARYRDLTPEQQAGVFTCKCEGPPSGAVWGSGIYTADSSICAAATHAGARALDGTVKVKAAKGCPAYVGSANQGVTSSNWGAYDKSFVFEGIGDGECAKVPEGVCPGSYKALTPEQRQGTFECSCEGMPTSGSVWGTKTYTTDSSICAAAVHAGAKGANGKVKVRSASGCPSYRGSEANGVTSRSWGRYDASFYFEGFGKGECSK